MTKDISIKIEGKEIKIRGKPKFSDKKIKLMKDFRNRAISRKEVNYQDKKLNQWAYDCMTPGRSYHNL